jgi:Uma2 family endonuclease
MALQTTPRVTAEEYLVSERRAETKSEFLDGEVFAMAGASRRHNLISLNVGAELRAQLRQRPCEVYVSDMRVKIAATGLYTYPDVVAVCDQPRFEDTELDTLLNPLLIVEVLSSSTEDYDRGGKFEHYRSLTSLHEYVLIAQKKFHVMHYARQPDNTNNNTNASSWLLTETSAIESSIALPSLQCQLALSEIYTKVQVDN